MKHSIPVLLLALAALPAAAQGTDTLVTITADAPRASNRCGAQEADFSLRAERDLTLEQRVITGYNDGFTYGSRSSSTMKRGDTTRLNTCISEGIPALEICAKADGQEQCWTPAYSGEDGSLVLAPGFALAASAPPEAAALQGAWEDKTSGRCHMSITHVKGDEIKVQVNWADGAATDNVWTFSGVWNKARQQLAYTDGMRVRTEDNGDAVKETRLWNEGAGALQWKGGALYWHDGKEQICKDCIFQRSSD